MPVSSSCTLSFFLTTRSLISFKKFIGQVIKRPWPNIINIRVHFTFHKQLDQLWVLQAHSAQEWGEAWRGGQVGVTACLHQQGGQLQQQVGGHSSAGGQQQAEGCLTWKQARAGKYTSRTSCYVLGVNIRMSLF